MSLSEYVWPLTIIVFSAVVTFAGLRCRFSTVLAIGLAGLSLILLVSPMKWDQLLPLALTPLLGAYLNVLLRLGKVTSGTLVGGSWAPLAAIDQPFVPGWIWAWSIVAVVLLGIKLAPSMPMCLSKTFATVPSVVAAMVGLFLSRPTINAVSTLGWTPVISVSFGSSDGRFCNCVRLTERLTPPKRYESLLSSDWPTGRR